MWFKCKYRPWATTDIQESAFELLRTIKLPAFVIFTLLNNSLINYCMVNMMSFSNSRALCKKFTMRLRFKILGGTTTVMYKCVAFQQAHELFVPLFDLMKIRNNYNITCPNFRVHNYFFLILLNCPKKLCQTTRNQFTKIYRQPIVSLFLTFLI